MNFSAEQVEQLGASLDGAYVKTRKQGGKELSYIEGWKAIEEANRIFGFDAWDRETRTLQCVHSGEYNGKPFVAYLAAVRITVRPPTGPIIIREGTGYGSGYGANVGDAHESAAKEAETDAMKRALMTFGYPFGLALYDKAKEHVEGAVAGGADKPPKASDPTPVANVLDGF